MIPVKIHNALFTSIYTISKMFAMPISLFIVKYEISFSIFEFLYNQRTQSTFDVFINDIFRKQPEKFFAP